MRKCATYEIRDWIYKRQLEKYLDVLFKNRVCCCIFGIYGMRSILAPYSSKCVSWTNDGGMHIHTKISSDGLQFESLLDYFSL